MGGPCVTRGLLAWLNALTISVQGLYTFGLLDHQLC
jgi:hypothetical protein